MNRDNFDYTEIRRIREETQFVQKLLKSVIRDLTMNAYDPAQPRLPAGQADGGRWTSVGSSDEAGKLPASNKPADLFGRLLAASKRSLAYCKAQFERDLFQCRMVGLSSCYSQAIVRQIACEKGHPIPPLNY